MRFDPLEDVIYRRKLAQEYLSRAQRFLQAGDFKESVEAAQLAAENAAKSVVALIRIPSWSHDPSGELIQISRDLDPASRQHAEELASIVHELAPEHGIATYGRPAERLTPWEIYDKDRSSKLFKKAARAVELMNAILSKQGIDC